ncbi:MAG TPA: hypothetical protein VMU42_00840 [Candidatus Sulfotelmatobacter sp.]|nr:hypothetical protein [Candidatus Sulfotelmatobacter sp.]
MITEILKSASGLDTWLGRQFGRPYHALLGVGLVVEIAQRLRELAERKSWDLGVVPTWLATLLFVALLLHQLGELHEHATRRGR